MTGSRLVTPRKRGANLGQLSDKQLLFVSCYLAGEMNAKKAAEEAGYINSGSGFKLLANPNIQRAIGREIQKKLKCNDITRDRVLKELARIGFSDVVDMFDDSNNLRQVREMSEDIRRCIAGVKVKQVKIKKIDEEGTIAETSIVEIKLWPKTNALELIAKHLGMLDERFKVEHGVDPASRAILKTLLEKLESQPSQVIDANYIEHAAGALPDINALSASTELGQEIGEVIDGKVIKPDKGS